MWFATSTVSATFDCDVFGRRVFSAPSRDGTFCLLTGTCCFPPGGVPRSQGGWGGGRGWREWSPSCIVHLEVRDVAQSVFFPSFTEAMRLDMHRPSSIACYPVCTGGSFSALARTYRPIREGGYETPTTGLPPPSPSLPPTPALPYAPAGAGVPLPRCAGRAVPTSP